MKHQPQDTISKQSEVANASDVLKLKSASAVSCCRQALTRELAM